MSETDRVMARAIWDYNRMGHAPRRCSVAVALGCHDTGVAVTTAHLYREGLFPLVVFTGASGASTHDLFPEGEAKHFRNIARGLGVPEEAMLVEPNATNTGENIALSKDLIEQSGLDEVKTLMLITMPYMERRAYATCRMIWPGVDIVCASRPDRYEDYVAQHGREDEIIAMMLGDLHRIIEYPIRGYSEKQVVPADVFEAFDQLRIHGYDEWLLDAPAWAGNEGWVPSHGTDGSCPVTRP